MTFSETIIASLNQRVFIPAIQLEDRDERASAEKSLSSSHYGPDSNRYAISLHDALAEILVSQKKGEVIAVGSNVTKHKLELYFTSNGNRSLERIKEQLERVWSIAKALEGGKKSSSGTSTPTEQQVKYQELRCIIYRHSMEKFMKRCSKAKVLKLSRFFHEVLKSGSSYVVDKRPGDDLAYILRDEVVLIEALKAMSDAVDEFKNKGEDKIRDDLSLFIAMVNEEFMKQQAFSDEGVDPFLTRCHAILEKLASDNGEQTPEPFAFQRFLGKIFSLEHSIQVLLRMTKSQRMSHVLKLDCNIIAVKQDKRPLVYNITKDDKLKKEVSKYASYDNFKAKWSGAHAKASEHAGDEYPHCECSLMAHFVNSSIQAYGYIGVSKLSCTGCSLYFKAYNESKKGNSTAFFTRGTHSKAYVPWVKPKLNDSSLNNKVEEKLCKLAVGVLAVILKQELRRKRSDSTYMSGKSGESETGEELKKANGGFRAGVQNFIAHNFRHYVKSRK